MAEAGLGNARSRPRDTSIMTESISRPGRRSVVAAAAAGGLLALVVIMVSSGFDVVRMTFGDGVLHRYVAENLSAPAEQVTADIGGHGTGLRYGRIMMPLLIWIGSAGQPDAMPYAQPVIMVLSAAAIAAAVRMLLHNFGWATALSPFIALGLTTSIAGGFAEPPAVAFAVWAVVLARRTRWVAAAALLALAMLTRENAAAVLAGLALWALVNRKGRGALLLACSVVPVVVWYVAVERRFGFIPLNDPFLRQTPDAFGPPVVAAWRALTRSGMLSTLLVVIHLAGAAVALTLWRASDLGAVAAASALQMLWNGPPQWQYAGDGLRLQVFLEVFLVLALVDRVRRRERRPSDAGVPVSVSAASSA
jgi:hypothetical protein